MIKATVEKEVWKEILGTNSLYHVSNQGNVKSVGDTIYCNCGHGIYRRRKKIPKTLSPSKTSQGYLVVNITINGKRRPWLVHRLVGLSFIPNPMNKPQINHRDGNRSNNRIDNLEWSTSKENVNDAMRRLGVKTLGIIGKVGELVAVPVLNTETGIFYDSITEAASTSRFKRHHLTCMLGGYLKNKSNFIRV